ncbi:sugar transferase [Tellurirhabdus bombi]|uniref:sugar transferase n=1 Tax=Tellurirhabdus bombi TaxID=2907205 RepID=UPI001F3D0D37|nr:sugar transferase [Tellurirhabdus bombi]
MVDFIQPNSSYLPARRGFTQKTYFATKRVCDILFSVLVTVFILSWLIPLIGLLIRLESRGPILFIQMRTGQNNMAFPCLKFRTMKYNKNAHFEQARRQDPRVTRIGAFLRKTNLDELPQFLNVLVGQMSVVGPRPHAVQHDAQFQHIIPNYIQRYSAKPGITGLSQARGLRGETGLQEMEHRLRLDLWYIQKQTPWLDIKICWWTVERMLKGDEKAC